jgi:secondary thiamine-phosphate synthase enzyme
MRHTNSNVGGRYRPAQDQGGSTVQTLKVARKTLTTLSEKRTQVLDITKQVRDIVLGADIKEGFLLVNSLHTTCALFVNEFQGALAEDLKTMMERLVADSGGYKHDDPRYSDCERGNASSHLRAALLGRSVAVGISGGELSLGRFQSIIFAELDGPRSRNIDIQIMGV